MDDKNRFITGVLAGCIACGVLVLGCWCSRPDPAADNRIEVIVSIPPQKYFVEKIGGDYCRVHTLIPAGASPHTFEPKPGQMTELANAQLYFTVGVEMEQAWLPKIRSVQPALKIVATDSGITKRFMDEADGKNRHEGEENPGGHHHEGADPHIWLSPDLVKLQARSIANALAQVDTQHAAAYRERLASFEAEVDGVKERIAAKLDGCKGSENFLVFHPSWGYFADAFSLRQIAIEAEGKEPGLRRLGEIAALAKREGIRAVLVQPQFSTKTAQAVARQLGGVTLIADPLAEDWAANLERIAGVLCGP